MPKNGKIFILVIEGRGMIAKDWGGSSDPYCKVYLDKHRLYKTNTIIKSLSPKWQEQAHNVELTAEKPGSVVKFSCWDYDKLKWDEFLGEVLIPVEELYDGVPRDDWFKLQSRKGKKDNVTGEIHIQILFLEPDDSITPERFEFPYPLPTLMKKKKFDSFKNALSKKDLELIDNEGHRPLHAACVLDLSQCVIQLLDAGADVRGGDERNLAQPLHYAAAHSHNSITIILAKGAELEARDKTDRRPLHYAATHNNPQSVNILVDKGANVNAQDTSGQTPLHRALQEKECFNSIRTLVERGADIYLEDKNGISCAKLCIDEQRVTDRSKREFMAAIGIKDDREFAVRKTTPNVYYIEGKNLSYEWKDNQQFGIKPRANTNRIIVLMHYTYEDKSAKQMEKTGFIIVTSDEGIHKEPSFQQDLLGYGAFEPFEIQVQRRPDKEIFYILMPYAKTADVKGYFDMIVYADGDIEIKELINWNNVTTIQGEWTTELSGGDRSLETWLSNPQFTLTLPRDENNTKVTLTILLTQAKAALDLIPYQVMPYQFYIGYYVLDRDLFEIVAQCDTWKNAQETYIHFFIDTSKDNEFVIIPATHNSGQLTSFTITVFSDVPVQLTKRN